MTNEEKTNQEETTQQDTQEEVVEEVFAEEVEEDTTTEGSTSELTAKLEESENKYLRLRADFDNYRRRVQLDEEANKKFRAQSLVTDLLTSLDNFERALQVETENEQTQSLLQGMEMVYRGIQDALKREGVEEIDAQGAAFDPHLHQAVMQESTPDAEPNSVTAVFQKGYKLHDRVIRPAMVKVNE